MCVIAKEKWRRQWREERKKELEKGRKSGEGKMRENREKRGDRERSICLLMDKFLDELQLMHLIKY